MTANTAQTQTNVAAEAANSPTTDPTNQGTLVDGKPDLILPYHGASLTEVAKDIFQHAANSGRFFRRGQIVAKIVGQGTEVSIEPLKVHDFRSALDPIGTLVKLTAPKKGGPLTPQRAMMSSDQANQLLGCSEAVSVLPEIVGITKCPVLAKTANGSELCRGGYSPALKMWVSEGMRVPDVPVEDAVKSLLSLLSEFDFSTPSDRSRAFAAFITPMLHLGNWLPGQPVPIDVAEADQSQAGKTYRQKLVAAIYGNAPSYVNMKSGGVGGVDESIQGLIFAGKSFIALDNTRVSLKSEFLEQTITNTTGLHQIRLPGMKQVEVKAKFVVMVSSNSAIMTRDLANRSSFVRVSKKVGHIFRTDPLAIIESDPGYHVGCVAAVVREWAKLGCLENKGIDHDFRKWAGAMDYIVQNIARLPPLLDGHRAAQVRTHDPVQTFLRDIALKVEEGKLLGESLATSTIFDLASTHSVGLPGLDLAPLDEEGRKEARRLLGIKLKTAFRESACIELDRFTISRTEDLRERDAGKQSIRETRYIFTKSEPKAKQ